MASGDGGSRREARSLHKGTGHREMERRRQVWRRQFSQGHCPIVGQTSDCWPMHDGYVGTGICQPFTTSRSLFSLLFFALPDEWSRASTWRQVKATRPRKSGGSLNQRLVPDSSGFGDFYPFHFSESPFKIIKPVEVVLRHFETGLCFSQASARLIAQSIPLHLQAEQCRIKCVQDSLCGSLISPRILVWCDIRLTFVSE